jgi:predicted DNA-binding transcriptional regulator YafY
MRRIWGFAFRSSCEKIRSHRQSNVSAATGRGWFVRVNVTAPAYIASMTKIQRWLDLIVYLVGHRLPVTVEELMERVPAYAEKWRTGNATDQATARRTFERDKDELRHLGIPIQTVPYSINYGTEQVEGYRIDRRDFYLPYLKVVSGDTQDDAAMQASARLASVELREDDARHALDALRRVADLPSFPFAREARSAFRKLAFDLDPALLLPNAGVMFVERPGAVEESIRVRELSDALLARKQVSLTYHGIYRDEATKREVQPYGLLFHHGTWYLIGFDATRAAIRVFRVGRIEDMSVNTRAPNTPDYVIPEAFRIESYADRDAWELGGEDEAPIVAEILFRFPLSLWAERNRHGTLVDRFPDGATVRAFDVVQVPPFLRWLLSFEGEAEVLSPQELKDGLRTMARDVAALYSGESDA